LEAVLLIAITFVAIGIVAVYFFHVLGTNQTSVGLEVAGAQLSGGAGVLTISVENTGSAVMTGLTLTVTPDAGAPAITGSPFTLVGTSGTVTSIGPGTSYGFTETGLNPTSGSVSGYTYTLSLTATYATGQTYTYQTSVTAT
jgi:hypothetical protein